MKFLILTLSSLLLAASSFSKETILFIPGGPGFNSAAEEVIFSDYNNNPDIEFFFWSEPSKLRGAEKAPSYKDSYNDLVKTLKEVSKNKKSKVFIMAHSFGTRLALDLAQSRHRKKVKGFIFLNSVFNLKNADQKILNMALDGLETYNHEVYLQLKEKMTMLEKGHFGPNYVDAFLLANQLPTLLVGYWSDTGIMQQYFSYLVGEYQFDPENFFSIRTTTSFKTRRKKVRIPSLMIYGSGDPVVDPLIELEKADKIFTNYRYEIVGGNHYPHITKISSIFKFLDNFVEKNK